MPFVSNLPCWRLLCMMFTALVTPRWMSWKVVAGKPIRSLLHRTSLRGRRACAELVFNLADRTAKTEHPLPVLSVPAALLGWTPLFFSNHTVCDGSDRVTVVLVNVCFFIRLSVITTERHQRGDSRAQWKAVPRWSWRRHFESSQYWIFCSTSEVSGPWQRIQSL